MKSILKKVFSSKYRAKFDARYGIGRLERLFFSNWFNIFATIWINFRCLPFKQAIKLPIFAYGNPKFLSLSGKIEIKSSIRIGMIKFNYTFPGAPNNKSSDTAIYLLGVLVFIGGGDICTGCMIRIAYDGILELGKNSRIMDGCNISCDKRISIGENTQLAHRCQIFDGNFHHVANIRKHIISSIWSEVSIGKNCWICNSTTINKGCNIPDGSIVASHSLVTKDFSDYPVGSFFAGNPARFICDGMTRVFNTDLESKVFHSYLIDGVKDFPVSNLTLEDCW